MVCEEKETVRSPSRPKRDHLHMRSDSTATQSLSRWSMGDCELEAF